MFDTFLSNTQKATCPVAARALSRINQISEQVNAGLQAQIKRQFAAYFTPPALAAHMVRVANYQGGKLGDKGAGAGILSAHAAVQCLCQKNGEPILLAANEIQPKIREVLNDTYMQIKALATYKGETLDYEIKGDFLTVASEALAKQHGDYSAIIINPPYYKCSPQSDVNQIIKAQLGFTVPNIYAIFMLLSLHLLKENGTLTALVPRSFCNGRYFKAFRRYIKGVASIESITRYRSRSNLFKLDNVLQENCIVKFAKAKQRDTIELYTCDDPDSAPSQYMTVQASVLLDNPNDIIVLPADKDELRAYESVRRQPISWAEAGLGLSTGKLVEYRNKTALNYAQFGAMYVEAKALDTRFDTYQYKDTPRSHGNGCAITRQTRPHLVPKQTYLLLKRISSNSDPQRIHCSLLREQDCRTPWVALSNTLQYFHGEALQCPNNAKALLSYLRSPTVELAIRAISGTTQICADDLALVNLPPGLVSTERIAKTG